MRSSKWIVFRSPWARDASRAIGDSAKFSRGGLRLIGGHDYGAVWKIHKGVKRAVDEWVRDSGVTLETDADSTWWARVP